MSFGCAYFFIGQVHSGAPSDSFSSLHLCVCAMTDAADGRSSGAEDSPSEPVAAASSAPPAPASEPSSSSSSAPASSSALDQQSVLLQKIKDLHDTQNKLKEQKKKCAKEIKNAVKRKKRLQGKASQLSDADLVEVLRMRKAKKGQEATVDSTAPPTEPPPAS